MRVISQSTSERKQEIQDIFNQMKPHLIEGKSYSQALSIVKGNKTSYSHTMWYQDLLKYGESQGFPKNNFNCSGKYGVRNLHLHRNINSLTGYYWTYYYTDFHGKRRSLSDNDLEHLQKRVQNKKYPWIVFNKYRFKKALEFNQECQKNKRPSKSYFKGRKSKSGVKHVFKKRNKKAKKGYYWVYKYKNTYLQAVSLSQLEKRVEQTDCPWILVDEKKYEDNILNQK